MTVATLNPAYLTTRELADLLRIKERKVYDLAANGDVPCVRVVGKLLFPRSEVEAWIAASRSGPGAAAAAPPPIIVGSHDPLLDWALRESGSGLAAFLDGSLDGLERFARREAMACGLHLHEADGAWNVNTLAARMPGEPVVLVEFARRRRGLIVAPGNPLGIGGIEDLAGRRVARRQAEAASQRLFEERASAAGLDLEALAGPLTPARTEADLAQVVREGKADAAFGIAAAARQLGLDFVPMIDERFDLAVWRRSWFEPSFQRFLRFLSTDEFRNRAAESGGYAIAALGAVHYNAAVG
ncbi:helix-turn-helix transcriptional regulator [Limibaculum sp. M0105]|uniref:Helix-turn-helix transcriptional regulator n=1 Tax=Thermohalobaculum xanthum TaxID=2753746 RepID=A0A8J7SBY9_9RHOB|nr:helix-turn-helix transcriptional regulator [Thermohalobaculum xanthum]MBK0399197.1 helix-turn-helix transcriptional regulator [Thermohalobaculum xanthum]